MDLIRNCVLVSSAGNRYYVQLMNNINGVQFLKFTKAITVSRITTEITYSVWSNHTDRSRFTYYQYDPSFARGAYKRFKRCVAIIDSNYVNDISVFAYRMNDTKFNVQELYNFAASRLVRIIINGVAIRSTATSIDATTAYEMVMAIYLHIFKVKCNVGITVQAITQEIKQLRNGLTFFEAIKKFVKDNFVDNFSGKFYEWIISALVTERFGCTIEKFDEEKVFSTYTAQRTNMYKTSNVETNVELTEDDTWFYVKEASGGGVDEGGATTTISYQCKEVTKRLVKRHTPGDGSCLLHAIGIALKVKDYAKSMHAKYGNDPDAPDCIREIATPDSPGEWGDQSTLVYLADKEKVNFCLHAPEYYEWISSDSDKWVHIHYESSHFSGMTEAEGANDDEDNVESTVAAPPVTELGTELIRSLKEGVDTSAIQLSNVELTGLMSRVKNIMSRPAAHKEQMDAYNEKFGDNQEHTEAWQKSGVLYMHEVTRALKCLDSSAGKVQRLGRKVDVTAQIVEDNRSEEKGKLRIDLTVGSNDNKPKPKQPSEPRQVVPELPVPTVEKPSSVKSGKSSRRRSRNKSVCIQSSASHAPSTVSSCTVNSDTSSRIVRNQRLQSLLIERNVPAVALEEHLACLIESGLLPKEYTVIAGRLVSNVLTYVYDRNATGRLPKC